MPQRAKWWDYKRTKDNYLVKYGLHANLRGTRGRKPGCRLGEIICGVAAILSLMSFMKEGTTGGSTNNITIIPKKSLNDSRKHVLAIYFPQFHQFDENDRFWGKGYTDFVGISKRTRNHLGQYIIRPSEHMGFYNLENPETRRHQGQLAQMYGISGFAIYHYWFQNRPVMDKPLKLMLKDGYPDIPFLFIWANEPWTRRWDGQYSSEILLDQNYSPDEWENHFEWLLPFFKHKNYILRNGKPVFGIYRPAEIPRLVDMTAIWQKLALLSGLNGIFFVQINGIQWTPNALLLQQGMDATAEFYPNYSLKSGFSMNEVLSTKNVSATHFWGACAAFDNSPRHTSSPETAVIIPSHPEILKYWLRQNLARSKENDYVFVNAWNEWGEGAAVEPSMEWGRRWLAAIKEAIEEERTGKVADLLPDGFARSIPLDQAGVPYLRGNRRNNVCIVIRTHVAHLTGVYNLHQSLNSILQLSHKDWISYLVNTGKEDFHDLLHLAAEYNITGKIHVVSTKATTFDHNHAYEMTDAIMQKYCLSSSLFDWMLITNGDNWYTPDALNFLPEMDLVLLNFYSRYATINEAQRMGIIGDHRCCERVDIEHCVDSQPVTGFIDLGAVVFRTSTFRAINATFSNFADVCPLSSGGCHDGMLIEFLISEGLTYAKHPLDVCAMYHNENARSCEMLGGYWFDSLEHEKMGCYYLGSIESSQGLFPKPVSDMKHDVYVSSKFPCIC